MALRDYNPDQAKEMIFVDPRTSFHGLPNTQGRGVLYVPAGRESKSLALVRFDPVTGDFIESVAGSPARWYLNDQEYQGPLAQKIQQQLERHAQSQPSCKPAGKKRSAPYNDDGPDQPGGRPGGLATIHFH